jgi:hypothetical protein
LEKEEFSANHHISRSNQRFVGKFLQLHLTAMPRSLPELASRPVYSWAAYYHQFYWRSSHVVSLLQLPLGVRHLESLKYAEQHRWRGAQLAIQGLHKPSKPK